MAEGIEKNTIKISLDKAELYNIRFTNDKNIVQIKQS